MMFLVVFRQHLMDGYLSGPDDLLLLEALRQRGIQAHSLVWDDRSVDWSIRVVAVNLSPWKYHFRLADFLSPSEGTESQSTLCNSVSVVHRNAHKSYLQDLEQRGIPVVLMLGPERGEDVDLETVMTEHARPAIVMNPVVSANVYATIFITQGASECGRSQVQGQMWEHAVISQPSMASVTEISGDYGRTFRNKVVVGSSSYEKMLVRAMADEGEYSRCILCTAAQGLDLGNERSFLIAHLDYVHDSRAIVRLIGIPSQPADRVVDAVFLQVQRGELFEHLIPLLESDYSEPLASLSHGFTAKDN